MNKEKQLQRDQAANLIDTVIEFRQVSKYRLAKDLEITATRLNDYHFKRRAMPVMIHAALFDMLEGMCECGGEIETGEYCEECKEKFDKENREIEETYNTIKRDL